MPASRVSIQPPGGKTLVNLETIFSTQAQEFTRTIGLLGHRVDLQIWPSRFEWVTGDGADFATDWAGRPWEKGVPMGEYITHLYDDAADVTTRVDTTWTAKYRVDGGSWQDVGGTVTIEGEPFDLAVLQRGAAPRRLTVAQVGGSTPAARAASAYASARVAIVSWALRPLGLGTTHSSEPFRSAG